jgi:hypothetical protein
MVMVLDAVADATVLSTSCDTLLPSLKTPFIVTLKSDNNKSRSIAALSIPVTSCTALGIAQSTEVISFSIDLADPPESSTATVTVGASFAISILLYLAPSAAILKSSIHSSTSIAARCISKLFIPTDPFVSQPPLSNLFV